MSEANHVLMRVERQFDDDLPKTVQQHVVPALNGDEHEEVAGSALAGVLAGDVVGDTFLVLAWAFRYSPCKDSSSHRGRLRAALRQAAIDFVEGYWADDAADHKAEAEGGGGRRISGGMPG